MAESGKPARELNVGEVLSQTFDIFRRDYVKYLAVFLVFEGVVGALSTLANSWIVLPASLPPTATPQEALQWLSGYLSAALQLLALTLVISWIFGMFAYGTAVKLASMDIEAGQANVGVALRSTVSKIFSIWVATLVVGFLVGVGFVALLVPGVILGIMFSMVLPAIVVEGKGVGGSMGRSRELASHRWLKMFAILLLVLIMVGAANLVIGLIVPVFGVWRTLATGLLSAFYMPLVPIALVVCYYSNAARIAQPTVPPMGYGVQPQQMVGGSFGFCPACGAPVMEAGQGFCRKCGHSLKAQ